MCYGYNLCSFRNSLKLQADFSACLKRVEEKLQLFSCETTLQKARNTLQQQVFEKAEVKREIYLMNMPTGSGKTLCSVKFALQRAVSEGKKRIIYVIPYNSIIDQTADIFEKLFQGTAEILRHQSTFSYEDEEQFDEDYRKSAKTLPKIGMHLSLSPQQYSFFNLFMQINGESSVNCIICQTAS